MKTQSLLSAVVIAALMSFAVHTWARDDGAGGDSGQGDNNDDQGENCQGGHIDGSETLIATVALMPTTDAPADAGGVAKLISDNEDGVVSSSFSLSITGLTTGTYDLSVVRKSDGSSVDLGQFVIGGCNGGDGEGDDNEGDGGDGEQHWAAFLDAGNVQLPPDLDPMDIAQVLISDTNSVVLLSGDLVNPSAASSIKFKANVRIHSANSSQPGKALAFASARKGKQASRFMMIASGVAPNSTFSVSINGQNAGVVNSNGKGKVLVRKIPANLLVVKSVHLVDANGNTAIRAKF